jgi:hypothetical protein
VLATVCVVAIAITARRFSLLIGLVTYSSIPASRQRSRSPFMAWAVDNGNMIAGSFFLGTEYRLDFNKF